MSSPRWGLIQVQQHLQCVLGNFKCLLGKQGPPSSSSPLRPLQRNIKMAELLLSVTFRPIFLLPWKRWVNLEFGEEVGVAVKEFKSLFGFPES